MLHQEWKRRFLGEIERAFDFIHGVKAPDALGVAQRKRNAALAPGEEVPPRGRMERMKGEIVCGESAGQFAHIRRRVVIEMVSRPVELDGGELRPRAFSE